MPCTVSQHPTNGTGMRSWDLKLPLLFPPSCSAGNLQPYLPDTLGLSESVWTAMVKLARVFELTGAIKIVT